MQTPIPEAIDGFRRLWERRNEFEQRDISHGNVPTPKAIGAALLMAGDPTPLKEPGLIEKFPKDLVSRIFLFSPSVEVRSALSEAAAQPLGRDDAEAVWRVLQARGDTTSPLAREAAAGRARGRWALFLEIAPYAGVALFLLACGWLPPNRGYLPAVAASLAYTGVLLKLLKLQVGSALWIPVAGDVLLLISAFLYGGVALRLLTTAMILGGILQLMIPDSTTVGSVTFLLMAVYLAAISIDALSRRLPGRIPRRFGIAFLATWWILIVPCVVLTLAVVTRGPSFLVPSRNVSEVASFVIAAAIVLPPLIVLGSERRRRQGVHSTAGVY